MPHSPEAFCPPQMKIGNDEKSPQVSAAAVVLTTLKPLDVTQEMATVRGDDGATLTPSFTDNGLVIARLGALSAST
jgi:hypothetical protein